MDGRMDIPLLELSMSPRQKQQEEAGLGLSCDKYDKHCGTVYLFTCLFPFHGSARGVLKHQHAPSTANSERALKNTHTSGCIILIPCGFYVCAFPLPEEDGESFVSS